MLADKPTFVLYIVSEINDEGTYKRRVRVGETAKTADSHHLLARADRASTPVESEGRVGEVVVEQLARRAGGRSASNASCSGTRRRRARGGRTTRGPPISSIVVAARSTRQSSRRMHIPCNRASDSGPPRGHDSW